MEDLNFQKLSKTKDGREKIIKELSKYSGNMYLRERDDECWTLFNNTGDDKEFEFLTKVGQFVLPAKIRRIPIQRSKANILLSSQSTRNPKFGLKIIDTEGVNQKLTRLYQVIMAMIYSFINQKYRTIQFQIQQIDQQVAQMQQMLQQEPQNAQQQAEQEKIRQELPGIIFNTTMVKDNIQIALAMSKEEREEFVERLNDEYEDMYELYAHKVATKLREEMDVKSASLKNFRNKIVVGREAYYVNFNTRLKALEFKSINPYVVTYPSVEDIDWIQDLPWVMIETHMTKEQIRNAFTLTAKQLKELDVLKYSSTAESGAFVTGPGQAVILDKDGSGAGEKTKKFRLTGSGIPVRMIWWRADHKIQAIQSPNKFKEGSFFTNFISSDKDVVDTQQYDYNRREGTYQNKQTKEKKSKNDVVTYNSSKGQRYEVRFFDKRYFGVNIGNSIILSGEDPVQPKPKDSYDYTPLPIVGKTYNGIGDYPYSIIWATAELQKQYWIISYHRELTFALAGASGVVFDLSQKPDGMSKEEWFYHMKLGRYLIQTISKTGARKNTGYNQFSRVDQTLTQSIQYFELILQGIEQQIGTIMGVPRQRQGEVVNSDQVGTFQQSNRQAMLVTEILYSEHDEVEVKAMEMLVNLAMQYKYKPGDVLNITEGEASMLRIPEDMHLRKFKVKMLNSAKQEMDLDEMKRMFAQMSMRGAMPFEFIFKLFSVDSLKELENLVDVQVKRQQELAQLQNQGTIEAQERAKRLEMELKLQYEEQLKVLESKLEEAKMKMDAMLKQRELDIKEKEVNAKIQESMVTTQQKVAKESFDAQMEDRKQSEQERSNRMQEALDRMELELEALLKSTGINQNLSRK